MLGAAVIGSGVALFPVRLQEKGPEGASPGRRKAATGVLLICIAMAVGSGFMLAREIGQCKGKRRYLCQGFRNMSPRLKRMGKWERGGAGGNRRFLLLCPRWTLKPAGQGPDVKAWLELPGTVIQYPVGPGRDNSYYLKHLYDGTAKKVGCLFIDYENAEDFSDNNTIIYGHNMRDGSMFSTLVEYKAQAYYDEHPEMYLVTPEGGYVVGCFSAFVASPEESGSETSPGRWNGKTAALIRPGFPQCRSVL